MAQNSKRGFFRSAMSAMMAARERQAQHYVDSALLMLGDDALRAHGRTREELRRNGAHRMF